MWEGAPGWRDAERGMGKIGGFKGERKGRERDRLSIEAKKKEGRSPLLLFVL